MKITIVNKEIIKKLSVHDGILGPITYNYEDKSCIFEVMNPGWNRHQTFHIKGILYMEVQQCEFAGPIYFVGIMMKNLLAQKNYIEKK